MLDDVAFARSWRQSRERQRPKGALALRWELRRKGVEGEIIDQALEGLDEEENAYRAATKAVPSTTGVDLLALRRKLIPYLRRRGFGAQTAERALHRFWEELSDPHDGDIVGEGCEKQQE
jgi:regulatory protein